MSSVERGLRWRPPIGRDNTVDSASAVAAVDEVGGGEALVVDSDDDDCLNEDEDVYGYFVLCLNCPTEVMFLMRRMDRAAPQSMKAKVAPFHNFILERGGALKLCWRGEIDKHQTCSNTPEPLNMLNTFPSCHIKARRTMQMLSSSVHHISLNFPWIRFCQRGCFFFTVSLLFLILLSAHFHFKWVHDPRAWHHLLTPENAVCV